MAQLLLDDVNADHLNQYTKIKYSHLNSTYQSEKSKEKSFSQAFDLLKFPILQPGLEP